MRDHVPLPIAEFKGLFERGSLDSCPSDHLADAGDVAFGQNEVRSRDGTEVSITKANILRMHLYRRTGEVDRLIILVEGGDFFDSVDLNTPILQIATATDFSLFNFYGRAYISPHNGLRGLTGEYVYVYNGTGTARRALGEKPVGTMLAVDSALGGNIEAGTHIFAVAYETNSGHITVPGPSLYTVLNCEGSKKVDLSDIPTGPAGTSKRHILSTKTVNNYDGNQNASEFFFVPEGTISNNTATTLTIDFFDQDLEESADYLFDQLESLEACLGLTQYGTRLVAWGGVDGAVVWVSKNGEPESINATDGFFVVDPTDAGPVECCVEFRNSLYALKSQKGQRTYVTADPLDGSEAGMWDVVSVDPGIGTSVFGVAAILDAKGTNIDRYVIADKSGLLSFNGLYDRPDLSWKIREVWKDIKMDLFYKVQVYNDPVKQHIYVSAPIGPLATDCNTIFFADYSDGLAPDTIKWSWWTFPWVTTSILIDTNTDGLTYLRIGSNDGNVWDMVEGLHLDGEEAIQSVISTALLATSASGELCHVAGIRLRVRGSGTLELRLYGEDNTDYEDLYSITMAATPGKEISALANFTTERARLRCRVTNAGDWFKINRIVMFSKVLWSSDPHGF